MDSKNTTHDLYFFEGFSNGEPFTVWKGGFNRNFDFEKYFKDSHDLFEVKRIEIFINHPNKARRETYDEIPHDFRLENHVIFFNFDIVIGNYDFDILLSIL